MSGRHRDKVRPDAADALAPLFDGARVMVGGFGLCGNAEALISGVVERGVRDLHLISNNAGNMGKGLAAWLRAGIVRKVTCTYLGNNQDLHQARPDGSVEIEVVAKGTFVERIRAAGAGIPAFYTPTGVGTVVAEGMEDRTSELPETTGLGSRGCSRSAVTQAHDNSEDAVKRPTAEEPPRGPHVTCHRAPRGLDKTERCVAA